MKFLWTTLYVKDLDASIAFYSDLVGLKAKRRFPAGPGREIAFMGDGEDGETVIELLRDENGAPRPYGEGVSMGFQAESVEAMLGKVSSLGIPVYEGPVDTRVSPISSSRIPMA